MAKEPGPSLDDLGPITRARLFREIQANRPFRRVNRAKHLINLLLPASTLLWAPLLWSALFDPQSAVSIIVGPIILAVMLAVWLVVFVLYRRARKALANKLNQEIRQEQAAAQSRLN